MGLVGCAAPPQANLVDDADICAIPGSLKLQLRTSDANRSMPPAPNWHRRRRSCWCPESRTRPLRGVGSCRRFRQGGRARHRMLAERQFLGTDGTGLAEGEGRPVRACHAVRPSDLMIGSALQSLTAVMSSSRVFITIGPCQATGSRMGDPDTRRKRTPWSPACTTTSSPAPKTTSVRLPLMSRRCNSSPSTSFSIRIPTGSAASRKRAEPSKT